MRKKKTKKRKYIFFFYVCYMCSNIFIRLEILYLLIQQLCFKLNWITAI
jgi:hypothetical protein